MKFELLTRLLKRDEEDRSIKAILDGTVKPSTDGRITAHRGLIALFVGLGLLILWAALAPLSQGVPVSGFVKVEGNRKSVQHLRGGIVDAILVKEGDSVVEGQPLLRLNQTQLKAQLGVVESQLISGLATEARLVAEQQGGPEVRFDAFLIERAENQVAKEAMETQRLLFKTRQSALKGEVAIGNETIAGLEQQVLGLSAQEKARGEQIRLFSEELSSLRPMYEQGFIPRNRMFELERSIAYLNGQRSEELAMLGRARSQISEIRLRMLQVKNNYLKEVEAQLAQTKKEVSDLRERFVATQDDLERSSVRSPIAGIVVGMSVFTVGGVVAPGQVLMDVVPLDQPLMIEAMIPTQLIDNVRAGLDADIHFPAFDQFVVPRIPGRLVYVSADRLTDPKTGEPYFLGRVEVKPESVQLLGKRQLLTGMPANVVIITGERSFLSYILRPIVARLHFAFTER